MASEVQKSFPIGEAYDFAKDNGLGDRAREIRGMEFEGVSEKRGRVVRKGYLIRLFEDRGIYTDFIGKHWSHGLTVDGQRRRDVCVRYADEYASGEPIEEGEESEDIVDSVKFAIEAHLRDFLAKGNNLNQIESGLHVFRDGGKTGAEYAIDNGRGRIDILAVDSSGGFVVIELKLGQGRNKALGQLLYYMGWIDRNLGAQSGSCRGLIIANEIPEELTIAVSQVPRVKLARYQMNFSIEHM